MKNTHIIPYYVFEWGWETAINEHLFEKEVTPNQTYFVIQNNDFNPHSSWNNHQKINDTEIGQSKTFLQCSRYAEVNGVEWTGDEMDFMKIIIGKILKINLLKDYSESTQTFPAYHDLTPVYQIHVNYIFDLKDYLYNQNIDELVPLKLIGNIPFCYLHHHDDCDVYADLFNDNTILIEVNLSEYAHQVYVIVKENIENTMVFSIRLAMEHFCDTETYQLADYRLNADEVNVFAVSNPICQAFFQAA